MSTTTTPRYLVELRPVPDSLGREPHVRLRQALKRLKRDYGLACASVGETPEPKGDNQ